MLDTVQDSGGRVIVEGYRRIASRSGCAPTAKTADAKIIEIYSTVVSAFREAEKRGGEHIPALYLNTIVLKFLHVYEMLGEPGLQQHLKYEVNKYLAEGLREDYKRELSLFDEISPSLEERAALKSSSLDETTNSLASEQAIFLKICVEIIACTAEAMAAALAAR